MTHGLQMAVVVKTVLGSHFGVFSAPPILEAIFSWGLGCSLGVRDLDPWAPNDFVPESQGRA